VATSPDLAVGKSPTRRRHLLSSSLLALSVLLVPSFVVAHADQQGWLFLGQVIVAGIILGIGAPGIDLLLIRAVGVSLAMPIGWYAGGLRAVCSSPHDCYIGYALGLPFFWALTAILVFAVATMSNLAWTRRPATLAPELARLLPRARWQWALLAVGGMALLAGYYLSLGIPAY
jgi:hypothetical protein